VTFFGAQLSVDLPRRISKELRGELFVARPVFARAMDYAPLDLVKRRANRECKRIDLRFSLSSLGPSGSC
jgi:hypothetical protein